MEATVNIKSILLFLFIVTLWVPVPAVSQTCSTTRLDQKGGPLEGASVLDQDGLGICESYAAVKIIDAFRFYKNGKKKPAFQTSPIPLAVQAATKMPYSRDLYGGAIAHEIVQYGLENGACSHEAVQSKFGKTSNGQYCEDVKFLIESVIAGTNLSKPKLPSGGASECRLTKNSDGSLNNIEMIANALQTSPSLGNLNRQFEELCKHPHYEHLQPAPKATRYAGPENAGARGKQAGLKAKLDSILDSAAPMPVGIRYCGDFLAPGAESSVGIDPADGKFSNDCNGIGRHASVIIGRRSGPRGCQYLIQNSWGTSCNLYSPRWECEKGKVWVDETVVLQNTASLFFMEAK